MPVHQKFLGITAPQIVELGEDMIYGVKATTGDTLVHVTLRSNATASIFDNTIEVSFVNGGAGNDTITRTKGRWDYDGFIDDMIITVAGTASNNGAHTIQSISDDGLTITLTSVGTVTNEDDVVPSAFTAEIPAADWILHETITGGTEKVGLFEMAPGAIRFTPGTAADVWVVS